MLEEQRFKLSAVLESQQEHALEKIKRLQQEQEEENDGEKEREKEKETECTDSETSGGDGRNSEGGDDASQGGGEGGCEQDDDGDTEQDDDGDTAMRPRRRRNKGHERDLYLEALRKGEVTTNRHLLASRMPVGDMDTWSVPRMVLDAREGKEVYLEAKESREQKLKEVCRRRYYVARSMLTLLT